MVVLLLTDHGGGGGGGSGIEGSWWWRPCSRAASEFTPPTHTHTAAPALRRWLQVDVSVNGEVVDALSFVSPGDRAQVGKGFVVGGVYGTAQWAKEGACAFVRAAAPVLIPRRPFAHPPPCACDSGCGIAGLLLGCR